jgi:hypothetical protein
MAFIEVHRGQLEQASRHLAEAQADTAAGGSSYGPEFLWLSQAFLAEASHDIAKAAEIPLFG